MSKFKTFRLDGNSFDDRDMEFYFKVENEDGYLLGNFCINGSGLFYYRRGAHVLTPNENPNALANYNGFLSFEKLKELFEALPLIGYTTNDEDNEIIISQSGEALTLEYKPIENPENLEDSDQET